MPRKTKTYDNELDYLRGRVDELEKLLYEIIDVNKKNAEIMEANEKKHTEIIKAINKKHDEEIEKQQKRIEYLERQLYGQKSERMPTPDVELRKRENKLPPKKRELNQRARQKESLKKRKKNRESIKELDSITHHIDVPDSLCICPECGNEKLDIVSDGQSTEVIEMNFKKMVRKVYVQQVKSCKCGEYIVTAPSPEKVVEGGKYGPGVYATVAVGKCMDSLPLNRQSKIFERSGVHIAPSVVGSIFHQAAEKLKPIWNEFPPVLRKREIVQGDETRIDSQVDAQGKRKKRKLHTYYMWCFLSGYTEDEEPIVIYYKYSPGRGSEIPEKVLKGFTGILLVDGYGGYNIVIGVDGAERAGCISHMRRYFFESLSSYPPAKDILENVINLYAIEQEAYDRKLKGSPKHLALRQKKSSPIMQEIKDWCKEHKELANPENPILDAITYAENQWKELTLFLTNAKLPLDNNRSELIMRIIAQGRKNYLFVGNHKAGENLAILQSLTASCVANGVNPEEYLRDVLIRVNTHPKSKVKQLLPWNWKKHFGNKVVDLSSEIS